MYDDFEIEDYDQELEQSSTDETFYTEVVNTIGLPVENEASIYHIDGESQEPPITNSLTELKSESFVSESLNISSDDLMSEGSDTDDLISIKDELDKELNGSTKGQNISFGTAFCWNFCRAGTDAGNARYHVQHGC